MPVPKLGSVPFQEAIDHFRDKLSIPTERYDDMLGEIHAKAFTVAGATKIDLLTDIRSALDQAITDGTTITDFRKQFDAAVQKHGWSYKGKRGWRTRVIFDNNLRTAHMAGRWQQFQRVKKLARFCNIKQSVIGVFDPSIQHGITRYCILMIVGGTRTCRRTVGVADVRFGHCPHVKCSAINLMQAQHRH